MARPRNDQPGQHKPTEETRALVKKMYAAGIPQTRICLHLDINVDTLIKYYRAEMDLTLDGMISLLADNLFQDALNGDKRDREFWLRTRGGFVQAQPQNNAPQVSEALLQQVIDKL